MINFDAFNDFDIESTINNKSNPLIYGEWRRIAIEPNPITGERYNIGVIFETAGQTYTKIIDKTERLNCLFDQRAIHNILFACKHFKELVDSRTWKEHANAFIISDPLPASGESTEHILEELYLDTVTLGRPKKTEEEREDIEIIERSKLIGNIYEHLRHMSFSYERFIPQNRELIVDSDGHTIDAPLYANNQIADIVSATNKSPTAIKNKINGSVVNLVAATSYRTDFEHSAMFIMKPTEVLGFKQHEIRKAEEAIDVLLWKLRKKMHLAVEETPIALAEQAAEWFDNRKKA